MNHVSYVNYDGSMEELVNEIANLRYDALENFLELLAAKLYKDALADKRR